MENNQENTPEENAEIIQQPDFETPTSVVWMKRQYARFQNLTSQNLADNLWVIGLKWALKGIMVFILILMSPFILIVILFSLMVAG